VSPIVVLPPRAHRVWKKKKKKVEKSLANNDLPPLVFFDVDLFPNAVIGRWCMMSIYNLFMELYPWNTRAIQAVIM
jgi:hypothetical protein